MRKLARMSAETDAGKSDCEERWKTVRSCRRLALTVSLLGSVFTSAAFGCRYSVRDVGFVDITSMPYRLYGYVKNDTPQDAMAIIKQVSYAALVDSNVEAEIINVDQQRDHPAMGYVHLWKMTSFPGAILVSPKGRSLELPISDSNGLFKEAVWSAFNASISSPKREEILEKTVRAYCVVLLIEGKDVAGNKRTQEHVAGAIAEIAKTMSQMVKPVEEPPCLVVIPRKSLSQEKVLLWSLGLEGNEISEPHAAVIYGRGRHIGPLLKGEEITRGNMLNILSVVGSACECGLDRKWVLGTMLPVRWGSELQSEATKYLGFDAESPMVKTEISQILSLGRAISSEGQGTSEGMLQGYREETIEFDADPKVAKVSPVQLRELVGPRSMASKTGSPFQKAAVIVAAVGLLVFAGGLYILLRARHRVS